MGERGNLKSPWYVVFRFRYIAVTATGMEWKQTRVNFIFGSVFLAANVKSDVVPVA